MKKHGKTDLTSARCFQVDFPNDEQYFRSEDLDGIAFKTSWASEVLSKMTVAFNWRDTNTKIGTRGSAEEFIINN